MNNITLKSRAKINLSIDIVGKRQDGYHLVEMIMQTIDLSDFIKIQVLDEDKIIIESNSSDIPLNYNNIVYKAAILIKDKFDIKQGVKIYIEKNIPIAAGMAGGSSNAAAVLVGFNEIFKLGLSEESLQEIGLKLGADVPFCISGRTAIARGIGEELTYMNGLSKNVVILICKPNLFVSTKEVYESLDLENLKNRPNNKKLVNYLLKGDVKSLAKEMSNVLESVTSSKYKEITQIEDTMKKHNALGSMMSGSGPTVFGIFEDEVQALECKRVLEANYKEVYLVSSIEKGVEICG